MDGHRNHHHKWSKSNRQRQISYDITYMWNLKYDATILLKNKHHFKFVFLFFYIFIFFSFKKKIYICMCIYFGVSAAEHGLFLVAASGVSTL